MSPVELTIACSSFKSLNRISKDMKMEFDFYKQTLPINNFIRMQILQNADFTEITPKENAPKITQEDYELLLDNAVLGNIPTSVLDTGFQRTADVIISDLFVENASFLRMDNITLGYTFNDVSKMLKSVRIWGGVQNVFTITNYSGLDPEVTDNDSDLTLTLGIDNVVYPRPRTVLVGANIKF